jgi:hypothetical protein
MPRWICIAVVIALALVAGSVTAQVASPTTPADESTASAADVTPVAEPIAAPTVKVSAVPEPGSVLLLGGPAAVGWVLYWRRRWRADSKSPLPA